MPEDKERLGELEKQLVTVPEAAMLRGVSRASIHALIKRKRLRPVVMFGRILLSRAEVEAFKKAKTGPKTEDDKGAQTRRRPD